MMIASLLTEWPLVHLLLVHFLLAVLLVVPILIVLAIFWPPLPGGKLLVVALLLLATGTVVSYFAIETGAAAWSQFQMAGEAKNLLQRHRSLAETTSLTFSALSVVFAAIVMIPRSIARQSSRVLRTALPAVFLVLYATGLILLAQTADMGRRLALECGSSAAGQRMSQNSDAKRQPVRGLGQR